MSDHRVAITRRRFLAAGAATGAVMGLAGPAALARADSQGPAVTAAQVRPPGPGASASDVYAATVGDVDVPVERLNFGDGVHVLAFAAEFPVQVRIQSRYWWIRTAKLRPARRAPQVQMSQGMVFTLQRPEHLVMEVPGWPRLLVFANGLDDVKRAAPQGRKVTFEDAGAIEKFENADAGGRSEREDPLQAALDGLGADGGGTLVLGAGSYTYRRGDELPPLVVPAGVTMHLEAGARLSGRIITVRGDNGGITGQGVLSGRGLSRGPRMQRNHRFLRFQRCRNARLDGVRIEQAPYWTVFIADCDEVAVTNVKIVNMFMNMVLANDGVDIVNSRQVKVDRLFYLGGDDAVVVKGFGGSRPIRDIQVQRVTALTSCAAAKIGTETRVPEITDVTFRDIDVLDCGRAAAIMVRDGAHTHNVRFENFHVERVRGANRQRLIDLLIERRGGLGRIENIRFKDFVADELSDYPPQVHGFDAEHRIADVTFQGLRIGGRPVHRAGDGAFDVRFARDIRFLDEEGGAAEAESRDHRPQFEPQPLPDGAEPSADMQLWLIVPPARRRQDLPVAAPGEGEDAHAAAFASSLPVALDLEVGDRIRTWRIDPDDGSARIRSDGNRAAIILTRYGPVTLRIDDLPPLRIDARPLPDTPEPPESPDAPDTPDAPDPESAQPPN